MQDERADYFSDLLAAIQRAPNEFPDAIPRKPRVLEELPLAAPLPPRAPTEAEIAREAERDHNARNMLVVSFTQLVQEFMRKYRKVVSSVRVSRFLLSCEFFGELMSCFRRTPLACQLSWRSRRSRLRWPSHLPGSSSSRVVSR
jgi:hypothetical protein